MRSTFIYTDFNIVKAKLLRTRSREQQSNKMMLILIVHYLILNTSLTILFILYDHTKTEITPSKITTYITCQGISQDCPYILFLYELKHKYDKHNCII